MPEDRIVAELHYGRAVYSKKITPTIVVLLYFIFSEIGKEVVNSLLKNKYLFSLSILNFANAIGINSFFFLFLSLKRN